MNITKISGKKVQFQPEKILNRIKQQSEGLNVNPDDLFKQVVQGVVDDMSTKEIDNLIAVNAAANIIKDPDYSKLGARIIITRQAKIIGVKPVDSDFNYDFFGIQSFLYKYSLRDDDGNPLELPHMMYKRVADYLELPELYDELRFKKISLATPILINSGTKRPSLISCNITMLEEDSTEGILRTLDDISQSSRGGAGLGLAIHNLRSKDTLVSSFKGTAGGVLKFCKMVQSHMNFFKQGKRAGSCAVYLGIWHRDVQDFLKMRLQIGDEATKTRDLFTAICIPDLFMQKLIAGETDWYTFCPHDVKKAGFRPLYLKTGKAFEKHYKLLVEAGIGKKESIHELWNMILTSMAEAGLPYVWFWDNANLNNPQDNIGMRMASNLCIEYTPVVAPGYTPQCALGLVALHNLEKNDFKEIERRSSILTIALNSVIDKNYWSTRAGSRAGTHQRSIGIGFAGLADYLAKNKIPFDKSHKFQDKLTSSIYKAAKSTSSHLASDIYLESYPGWKGSIYEKEGTPMANSLLTCLMPSASTSVLIGCNESFEPVQSNIMVRKIDKAEFIVINKHLVDYLKSLDMWNEKISNSIIQNDGSVQHLDFKDKEVFKTIWEYSQKDLIDLAAVRQKNIDQGQSMNLYFEEVTTGKFGATLKYAWEQKLPTGAYYTKTKSKLEVPKRLSVEKPKDSEFDCFGCSV